MAAAEKCGAYRITAPGVQIGHAGYLAHMRQPGGGFELSDGIALQPGIAVGDNQGFGKIGFCAHEENFLFKRCQA